MCFLRFPFCIHILWAWHLGWRICEIGILDQEIVRLAFWNRVIMILAFWIKRLWDWLDLHLYVDIQTPNKFGWCITNLICWASSQGLWPGFAHHSIFVIIFLFLTRKSKYIQSNAYPQNSPHVIVFYRSLLFLCVY